jgi:hypothetical protein
MYPTPTVQMLLKKLDEESGIPMGTRKRQYKGNRSLNPE